MIPISDSNPTRRVPWVTVGLIVVNIVVFPLWEPALRSRNQETYFYCNALVPYEVTHQTTSRRAGPTPAPRWPRTTGRKTRRRCSETCSGDAVQVDVRRHRLAARVHAEDRCALGEVRQGDLHLPVELARTEQGGVRDLGRSWPPGRPFR